MVCEDVHGRFLSYWARVWDPGVLRRTNSSINLYPRTQTEDQILRNGPNCSLIIGPVLLDINRSKKILISYLSTRPLLRPKVAWDFRSVAGRILNIFYRAFNTRMGGERG